MEFGKRTVHDEEQVAGKHRPGKGSHGTTIIGFIYRWGVMMASDSRIFHNDTGGSSDGKIKIFDANNRLVAAGSGPHKECTKLGSGLSSKCTTALIAAKEFAKIIRHNRGSRPRKEEEDIEFLVGSWHKGAELCKIDLNQKVSVCVCDEKKLGKKRKEQEGELFKVIGSGGRFAEDILKDRYHYNLDDQSACQLAFDAIQAGIKGDSKYSGGQPRIYRINDNGPHICENPRR